MYLYHRRWSPIPQNCFYRTKVVIPWITFAFYLFVQYICDAHTWILFLGLPFYKNVFLSCIWNGTNKCRLQLCIGKLFIRQWTWSCKAFNTLTNKTIASYIYEKYTSISWTEIMYSIEILQTLETWTWISIAFFLLTRTNLEISKQ